MTTLNDDGQSIWIVTSKNICHCKNHMKIFKKMPKKCTGKYKQIHGRIASTKTPYLQEEHPKC